MKLTIIIPVYNQQDLVIRALDSIPVDKRIETIVVDDGSTDKTFDNLLNYSEENQEKNIRIISYDKNQGVSHALNVGLDKAIGDYIVLLGSDDYFIPEKLLELLEIASSTDYDLLYFDLETNDGTIFHLDNDSKHGYCGSVKFMKRSFVGDLRNDETKHAAEDLVFYGELLKKNPTEYFSNLVVKHYNFPREGSLYWNYSRGLEN